MDTINVLNFNYWMPTKILMGENCISSNKEKLSELGTKALLVTGRKSAKVSGALQDITEALEELQIRYLVFDEVEENPSLETVEKAGRLAYREKISFVVGIGGGSPLDAAKAIAALATNQIAIRELYTAKLTNKLLPIVAIPTTAGTGSEVTQYSILTDHEMETKRNFSNSETFPTLAFLDPKYTYLLPHKVTVNTAIDFLSHAIEGYLSKRAMPISDVLAIEAIKVFREVYPALLAGEYPKLARAKLLYAAMLAGVVIAQTGTCMIHGLGYPLTFYGEIPHGRANGLLLAESLKFNYEAARKKIDNVLETLGLSSLEEFYSMMDSLLGVKESFSEAELKRFAASGAKQGSIKFTPIVPEEADLYQVLKRSLG